MTTVRVPAPSAWYERFVAAFLRGFLRLFFRALIGPPQSARTQRVLVDMFAWLTPGCRGTSKRRDLVNGVSTDIVSPDPDAAWNRADVVILYLHGGAFCLGNAFSHRAITTRLAVAAGAQVWVPDYRLAPEHPYPAGIDDAMACYQGLLDRGHAPGRIVIGGDSAGGALALAMALRLRERRQLQPAGLLLISPVTDPTGSGPTVRGNAAIDPMIRLSWVAQALHWYALPAHTPDHSPLEQDLAGLAPMLIQVGDREILLSDSTRLAEHASHCGVACRLEIHEQRWHVFQLQACLLPSAARAIRTLGRFAHDCVEAASAD